MAAVPELRVFLDTNVLFSGLYSSRNAPGKVLEYFIRGKLTVVISQQVLEEVVRVMKEKLPEALPLFNELLENSPPDIVADPLYEDIAHLCRLLHKEDASILAAAISAEVDYLVTGDRHFLGNADIAKKAGLRIITPTALIKLLEKSQL
jgi:putative PIN family toxin of toxin-antitoxin system